MSHKCKASNGAGSREQDQRLEICYKEMMSSLSISLLSICLLHHSFFGTFFLLLVEYGHQKLTSATVTTLDFPLLPASFCLSPSLFLLFLKFVKRSATVLHIQ